MSVDYNLGFRTVNRKTFGAENNKSCNVARMFRGDRLEALIKARGISQSELARRVGVSQATIWKLIHEPSQGSKHLHKIARELGTTAGYLMGEIDDPSEGAQPMPQPVMQFVGMKLALPNEAALTEMFESLLVLVPEGASRAEVARILAQQLPAGFAGIGPLVLDPGTDVAAPVAPAGQSAGKGSHAPSP